MIRPKCNYQDRELQTNVDEAASIAKPHQDRVNFIGGGGKLNLR